MRTVHVRRYGAYPLRLQGDGVGELLLAAYVALLPWEITRLFIPVMRSQYIDNIYLSALDGSRLWVVLPLCVVLPVIASRLANESSVPGLLSLSYGLFVLSVGLVLSPDRGTASIEVLRLGLNFAATVMIAVNLRELRAVERLIRWFCLSVDMAAVIVVVEFVTRKYLWIPQYAVSGRYNGPLVDPNISARYFMVAAALSISCNPRQGRFARAFSVVEPMLLLAALFFTGSRSSLLTVAVIIVLMLFLADGARRLLPLIALPVIVGASLVVALTVPALAVRLQTFSSPAALLGARAALINAGFHMFLDHPVAGVGLSGFAPNLLGPYAKYQSYYGAELNLSHTAIVTTAAELGIGGLLWFMVLGKQVVSAAKKARRVLQTRQVATGVLLGIVAIFFQSQSEGRFWEEPLLWALFGLLLALSRLASRVAADDCLLEASLMGRDR